MALINQYYSYNLNELPKGCQYCVRGEKLVLFVTGLCPRKCFYCPISDKKYQNDLILANERPINSNNDLILEAESMKAKGAGITGGDPLVKLDRTVEYIKLMKQKFGSHFHIHLYTSLDLVDEQKLKELYQAGLNEIRFHLDIESKMFWNKLNIAKKFSWNIGIEIPIIPNKEKETIELIDFIADKVDFLNLNELEIADNQHSQLLRLGYQPKNETSYGVKGSLELGLKMIDYIKQNQIIQKKSELKVHLCTAKLKDAVQLSNRIKRQAKYSKHDFDQVDEEGMLTRGALYFPELSPGFKYREKLDSEKSNNIKLIEKLESLIAEIRIVTHLKDRDLFLDKNKLRIILSKKNLIRNQKHFSKLNLVSAIVKEYPTFDQLEVEVEILK